MDLSFNLAPSNRDLKDPTSRRNFDDTVEQKRVIDLRACHMNFSSVWRCVCHLDALLGLSDANNGNPKVLRTDLRTYGRMDRLD